MPVATRRVEDTQPLLLDEDYTPDVEGRLEDIEEPAAVSGSEEQPTTDPEQITADTSNVKETSC